MGCARNFGTHAVLDCGTTRSAHSRIGLRLAYIWLPLPQATSAQPPRATSGRGCSPHRNVLQPTIPAAFYAKSCDDIARTRTAETLCGAAPPPAIPLLHHPEWAHTPGLADKMGGHNGEKLCANFCCNSTVLAFAPPPVSQSMDVVRLCNLFTQPPPRGPRSPKPPHLRQQPPPRSHRKLPRIFLNRATCRSPDARADVATFDPGMISSHR